MTSDGEAVGGADGDQRSDRLRSQVGVAGIVHHRDQRRDGGNGLPPAEDAGCHQPPVVERVAEAADERRLEVPSRADEAGSALEAGAGGLW